MPLSQFEPCFGWERVQGSRGGKRRGEQQPRDAARVRISGARDRLRN
jgi:hypothetical protein